MKSILPFFLVVVSQLLPAAATPDSRFQPIFGSLQSSTAAERLTQAQVHDLLVLAEQQGWNVFDLLNEAGLDLKARGLRVEVTGEDLRREALAFDLGDKRIEALLPLDLLVWFSLGTPVRNGPDLEIVLSQATSGYLEPGTFELDRRYGFRFVHDKILDEAYGVVVHSGPFAWKMKRLARVADPTGKGSPNFIALELEGLFQAKRWKIPPIKTRS